jgi:hypothetical protein
MQAPSIEGMEAVANAYAQVGLRAVIAPMVADLTFYHDAAIALDAMAIMNLEPRSLFGRIILRSSQGNHGIERVMEALHGRNRDLTVRAAPANCGAACCAACGVRRHSCS